MNKLRDDLLAALDGEADSHSDPAARTLSAMLAARLRAADPLNWDSLPEVVQAKLNELEGALVEAHRAIRGAFTREDEMARALEDCTGELADGLARDMDHRNKDHSRWYRAVKRGRRELKRWRKFRGV